MTSNLHVSTSILQRRVSQNQLLGLFPCVVGVAEMAVRRSPAIYRLLQVELFHDDTWSEIPVLADDIDKLQVGLLASAIRVDEDRQWLGDTNGVGELDECTASEAASDEGLS